MRFRPVRPRRWRAMVLAAAAAAVTAGCGGAPAHPVAATSPANPAASATPAASGGLGGYPSYLPPSTLHYDSDALETGTAAKPALVSQGDPVKIVTPHWSVVAVVSGPEVPGEGLPYQADTTTCTWIVTLSQATGDVPVSAAEFTSVDDRGAVYRPTLVPGQAAPPATLRPGQQATFELRAGEAVGEGLMRWSPVGGRIVAKWDFVVEND
jgi:hypothetical protein